MEIKEIDGLTHDKKMIFFRLVFISVFNVFFYLGKIKSSQFRKMNGMRNWDNDFCNIWRLHKLFDRMNVHCFNEMTITQAKAFEWLLIAFQIDWFRTDTHHLWAITLTHFGYGKKH